MKTGYQIRHRKAQEKLGRKDPGHPEENLKRSVPLGGRRDRQATVIVQS
jgi:hypothetical protein